VNASSARSPDAKTQVRYAIGAGELLGIIGGPLAWFAQFCAGYALASWPCFPKAQRALVPLAGYDWTWPAMIIVMIGGVIVALAAFFVSWRTLQRTQAAQAPRDLIDDGGSRRPFLALWGMVLGAGFALATLITAVAFVVLPRCAS
jgi:hypothetical protein